MTRRNPGITTEKIVEATKLLNQTLGEEEAKRFAYENVRALYPELVFPDISSNGAVESNKPIEISDMNPLDTYIINRLRDANGHTITSKQFYDGIRVNREIKGQSREYINNRLKYLDEKGYLSYNPVTKQACIHG